MRAVNAILIFRNPEGIETMVIGMLDRAPTVEMLEPTPMWDMDSETGSPIPRQTAVKGGGESVSLVSAEIKTVGYDSIDSVGSGTLQRILEETNRWEKKD